MAGRIRSIKPEILEDEKTAGLSHEAWRLFVSMWLLADDHGALRGDAAWLDGQVFWSTPTSGGRQGVEECIEELAAVDLVMLYEVRGQRYIQISGWSKHQKVDHPGKPRVPRPNEPGVWPIPTRRSDQVYFIRAENSRAVKIGVSWNPSRRLASLQAGHHERLTLEVSVPGDVSMERDLHARFASHRLSGEWFADSAELSDLIRVLVGSGSLGETSRETVREVSRESPRTLAPDLRPPISDLDLGIAAPPLQLQSDSPEPKRAARASRKKPAVAMPDGWKPRDHERNKAGEMGLNCDREAERFRDHHTARGSVFADWDAAFRTWLGNALRFQGSNAAGPRTQPAPVRVAARDDDDYSRIPGMEPT